LTLSAARTIRDRHDAIQRTVDRNVADGPHGAGALLVQTFTKTTYPVAAASFYAVHPVTVNGVETEGTAASYVVDTSTTYYAINEGTTIPPSGTNVLVSGVGGRWVFRYDA
jgi:hypothetical protein